MVDRASISRYTQPMEKISAERPDLPRIWVSGDAYAYVHQLSSTVVSRAWERSLAPSKSVSRRPSFTVSPCGLLSVDW